MKSLLKPAAAVLIIIISVLLSMSALQLPDALPVNVDKEEFSSARAMLHVEKIAIEPHPVGSLENQKVHDYIISELSTLGLKPELQKGHAENDVKGFMGLVPYSGYIENIFVRLEGTEKSNQAILMFAHYDSTLGGPGAADDISGVATLLETIRALKMEPPLKNDVIFLFTDGEEAGLLGAKLYADKDPSMNDIYLVMNFEARGNTGPSILFETSDKNGWFMEEFAKSVPSPLAYSFTSDVYKLVSNITDFTPFKDAGKNGFNFANLEGMETYHNPQDTPGNLNQRFLQHQGSYALSLARHFGNLSLVNRESSNAVYFTLMKSVLALYSEDLTIPLAILALILFIFVFIIGYRKQLVTLKGTILGFLVSLLTVIVSAGIGIIAQVIFSGFYYKLENVSTLSDLIDLRRVLIFQGNSWIIAVIALFILILLILHRLFHRKITYYNLLSGSLIIWSILTLLSSLYLKGASYMFVWPTILVSAGLLLVLSLKLKRNRSFGYFILFVLSALSCILIYLPVGYLLYQALTMLAAGIPIGLLALPTSLVISCAFMFMEKNAQNKAA